eukprot:CAMPEP_0168312080 /NCGR_PEP_ID=MMETSP0142_2-20121227/67712_1 /TAXON_ID=44445 /ORGANISM="Pseudo-nitzschia australis, Strain 10249 10 AB" /LENGTH=581 /DNA_ID=CAMNT_0008265027 /DNA_START=250 /DNA_END=1993 /DNA_ORIENTATION=+
MNVGMNDGMDDVSMVYPNDTVDFGTSSEDQSNSTSTTTVMTDGESSADSTQSETFVDNSNCRNNKKKNKNKKTAFIPIAATISIGSSSSSTTIAAAAAATNHSSSNHISNDSNNSSSSSNNKNFDCSNTSIDSTIIDNRRLEYIPVRLACGVSANCSPDVLRNCPMVLRSVQADLAKALQILPVSVHSLVRRTNLWLNWNGYTYGPNVHPTVLRHMTTHHHPAWLVEVAGDTPQKAIGIEIYSCIDYSRMRLHWNGSGLLLHELCHLIHQCCLEDGLQNKIVEALYERADDSGKYERVLRRDWAGKINKTTAKITAEATKNETNTNVCNSQQRQQYQAATPANFDLAYAMVDKKEFFAEISVAFLCNGYHALDKADSAVMEACSPPLLHPDVTERVRVLAVVERRRRRQHEEQHEHAHAHEFATTDKPGATIDRYSNHCYRSNDNEYTLIRNGDCSNNEEPKMSCHCHVPNNDCWAPFPLRMNQFARNIGYVFQRGAAFLLAVGKFGSNDSDGDHYCDNQQLLRMIEPVFREEAMNNNCSTIDHCNKFYPFTRGQLRHHDPDLLDAMIALWNEVAEWEDPW